MQNTICPGFQFRILLVICQLYHKMSRPLYHHSLHQVFLVLRLRMYTRGFLHFILLDSHWRHSLSVLAVTTRRYHSSLVLSCWPLCHWIETSIVWAGLFPARGQSWWFRHPVLFVAFAPAFGVAVMASTFLFTRICHLVVFCFSQTLSVTWANCNRARIHHVVSSQTRLTMHYLLVFALINEVQILRQGTFSLFRVEKSLLFGPCSWISHTVAATLLVCGPFSKQRFWFLVVTRLGTCLVCSSSVSVNWAVFKKCAFCLKPLDIFTTLWMLAAKPSMNTLLVLSLRWAFFQQTTFVRKTSANCTEVSIGVLIKATIFKAYFTILESVANDFRRRLTASRYVEISSLPPLGSLWVVPSSS